MYIWAPGQNIKIFNQAHFSCTQNLAGEVVLTGIVLHDLWPGANR